MVEMLHSIPRDKRKYLKIPIVLIISFILSNTTLFGKISPFSAAFVGSLSKFDAISGFLGAAIGFLAKGSLVDAIPNIIALMFICAFKWIFGKNHGGWVSLLSSAVSGVGVLSANVFLAAKTSDIFISIIFAVIAAIAAYSFIISSKLLSSKRSFAFLKPVNIAAFGITYAVIIAALSSFEVSIFNMGVTFSVIVSLSAAQKFKYSGGAITGIVAALGICTAAPQFAVGALMVGVAALGCALFVRFGKICQSTGFIFIAAVCLVLFEINTQTLMTMASILIGSLIYAISPTEEILSQIKYSTGIKKGTEISEIFSERLKLSAAAMNDVKEAIEKTGEILDKRNYKDISSVYNKASSAVCRKCRFNMTCWGDEYNDSVIIMGRIMNKLRRGEPSVPDDFSGLLGNRCMKKENFAAAINLQYKEYIASNAANRKIVEMRKILTAQLSATESMIQQMANEFRAGARFDRKLAGLLENILTDLGGKEVKAAVFLNQGRISAEAYGKGKLSENEEKVCRKISSALKIEFDLPEIEYCGSEFRVTMYERALFSIEYGVSQHKSKGEQNCGDYYDTFIDSKGYAYIILSDGMGKGGRARIDSAFASGMLVKLLRSGVNLSSAIEIINNSLLVKSIDESFATLDICRIDLYSGQAELFKAGAAPSYIRCNRKLIKAQGKGMPIGINSTVNCERQCFSMSNDDIIIMTTDGAEINEKWLERELQINEKKAGDMESIASFIASSAKYASDEKPSKGDDISVVAVRIVK